MRSLRFDTFRLDTVERTPTGGLKIAATPTRAGVLTYRRADGSQVRELRHPEEVFRPESLGTLAGAAVTDLHPPSGAVTPNTWKTASVGHVGETVTHDGRLVGATLYVNDADAIQKIQSGERKELSAGYFADTDETPGTYNGEPYDRIQRNIQYNHVSLQPPGGGRAGPECALRVDSDDAVLVDFLDTGQSVPEDAGMMLKLDGKEATQEAIDAVVSAKNKAEGSLAAEQAKSADLKKRLDAAEDPKRLGEAVKAKFALFSRLRAGYARLDAEDDAPDEEKVSDSDPVALMTEFLQKKFPKLDLKGKTPEFIMAAFEVAMANDEAEEAGEPEPATQAQDALTPARNSPPEMELNGLRARGDGKRSNPSADARARLRATKEGGLRHDSAGFPTDGNAEPPKSAYERQIEENMKRASAPLAASRS